jgi:cathepsin K
MYKIITFAFLSFTIFLIACQPNDINLVEKRALGLKKSSTSAVQAIKTAKVMSYAGTLPSKYTLEMPSVGNQGSESSCVAFATGYANLSYQLGKPFFLPDGSTNYVSIMSPEYIYNQVKVAGCESGSYFINNPDGKGVLDVLVEQGACSWSDMPYSDNGCDVQPSIAQKQKAASNKIARYERITDLSPIRLKTLLLNKSPIIIGASVDEGC